MVAISELLASGYSFLGSFLFVCLFRYKFRCTNWPPSPWIWLLIPNMPYSSFHRTQPRRPRRGPPSVRILGKEQGARWEQFLLPARLQEIWVLQYSPGELLSPRCRYFSTMHCATHCIVVFTAYCAADNVNNFWHNIKHGYFLRLLDIYFGTPCSTWTNSVSFLECKQQQQKKVSATLVLTFLCTCAVGNQILHSVYGTCCALLANLFCSLAFSTLYGVYWN